MNRRELLGYAASAGSALLLPRSAGALIIPPPPPSAWYLLFILNGIYQVSGLYIVTLPASAGTARNYDPATVGQLFGANFTYTFLHGVGAWQLMTNKPSYEWWEYLDKRNGRLVRLWKYDKIEVKFADGSRVRVVFRGQNASVRFVPIEGTERLPDGTRLYPRERGEFGGDGKTREGSDNFVAKVTPTISNFNWSYSDQETPW